MTSASDDQVDPLAVDDQATKYGQPYQQQEGAGGLTHDPNEYDVSVCYTQGTGTIR